MRFFGGLGIFVATAHLDCFSGIAGDMLLAALIDAGAPIDPIRQMLATLSLPVTLGVEEVSHCGVRALHLQVEAPIDQTARHLPEIKDFITRSGMPHRAQKRALDAFQVLAEAEAAIHNTTIDKVHFHEVGALDSITDILGSAFALNLLEIDRITAAPVPLGSGRVKCDHGWMPVPAPATALLMRGLPLAPNPVEGELTTPTGAAVLKAWVNDWISQPLGSYDMVGHGAGTRRYPTHPNLLRVFLTKAAHPANLESDWVWQLETTIDDQPGEVIAHAVSQVLLAGALDAYTIATQMKKGRPGCLLVVLAPEGRESAITQTLLAETRSLGLRRSRVARWKLPRRQGECATAWGPVRVKWSRQQLVQGAHDWEPSPEFDDCQAIALKHHLPLVEVVRIATEAARSAGPPPA